MALFIDSGEGWQKKVMKETMGPTCTEEYYPIRPE